MLPVDRSGEVDGDEGDTVSSWVLRSVIVPPSDVSCSKVVNESCVLLSDVCSVPPLVEVEILAVDGPGDEIPGLNENR